MSTVSDTAKGVIAVTAIFISHSSLDNREALAVRDWLTRQGWHESQIFLDLDNMRTGDRWRDVLNARGAECEAIVLCLSDNWIRSHECVREYTFAEALGKHIMPLIVKPLTERIPGFITDLQFANISDETHREAGFEKLKTALLGARIGPAFFPWPPPGDPQRAVYRGLQALDFQDAAIFFGRDAEILRGLDELRRLRASALASAMVVLGASGAGKSSFLRAGLLSRIRRDDRNFLVLPVIRPERAALTGSQGLAASLSAALGRTSLTLASSDDLASAFKEIRTRAPGPQRAPRMDQAHAAPSPTLILAIDQAEELFSADNAEGPKFCQLLSEAIRSDGNVLVILAVRSDAFATLQTQADLAAIPRSLFDLPPLPAGSFQVVIEGPAKLAKPPLTIEPALTQQLLLDLASADALPLLAFTLERLHSDAGPTGRLTVSAYRERIGGLSGAIQSAVDRVLGPWPDKEALALARRLFIPALVHVDQDSLKRRVALRAELPEDTHVLLERFLDQRLLVADGDTVEVTHEAILRQWPALTAWVAEERQALIVLANLRAAAGEWAAHSAQSAESKDSWLVHRGERLAEARLVSTRPDFTPIVDETMRAYLAACGDAEIGARRRRTLLLSAVLGLAALVATGSLAYAFQFEIQMAWTRASRIQQASPILVAAMAQHPGAVFRECSADFACPEMVVIPPGAFRFGSPSTEPNRYDDEDDDPGKGGGQVFVKIGKPFAVSKFEITHDQWARCVQFTRQDVMNQPGKTSIGCAPASDLGYGAGTRPVMNVSWDDAQAYIRWLNMMVTGDASTGPYRLLTETEWEYAARAGSTSTFYWGENVGQICEHANVLNAEGKKKFQFPVEPVACEDGYTETAPVGSFKPNAFGLHDMLGNVWEFVEDCYHDSYAHQPTDGSAFEQADCETRAMRGGGWSYGSNDVRSAVRGLLKTNYRGSYFGFRIARTLTPASGG